MRAILSIAKYTFIEQIRNRLYLIILFFGAAILGSSLLLGALAPGHKVRVIFDVGILALELFGLTAAVFGAVTLVLQEIESKTIYLILTRPISRTYYIFGRFLGLVLAVTFTMISMAGIHILTMVLDFFWFKVFIENFNFAAVYPTLILMSLGKVMITAAVAIFFSLFATSSVSALVFTGFFWVAGHFTSEMTFLIRQSFQGVFQKIILWGSHVFPNFHYFNFRDTFQVPGFPGFEFLGWALLYGFSYTGFFLILSSLLFARKEF